MTAKNTETELSMRMFCKYCCKYEKAGSFVVISPVFKLESIKAHNNSASHMKAESNPGSSVADETVDQLEKATFYKIYICFFGTHVPLPDTQGHNIIQILCGCVHWMT